MSVILIRPCIVRQRARRRRLVPVGDVLGWEIGEPDQVLPIRAEPDGRSGYVGAERIPERFSARARRDREPAGTTAVSPMTARIVLLKGIALPPL